jgi:hypothetical protein
MLWFRKLLAVLLISFGAALVFLPFPGSVSVDSTEVVVHLEVGAAPLTPDEAARRYGESLVELTDEALAPLPALHDSILALADTSGGRCVPPAEWRAGFGEVAGGAVYVFQDGIHRVTEIGVEEDEVCFEAEYVGAYDHPVFGGFARVDADELVRHPEIMSTLEAMAADGEPREIAGREWYAFIDDLSDLGHGGSGMVALDRLFTGRIEDRIESSARDTAWSRGVIRGVGAAMGIAGLCLLLASYRLAAARRGIPVGSPALAVFTDVIALIWGIVFVGLMVDAFWVGPLGQTSLLGLEPEWPSDQAITGLHFVAFPAVVLALPLLTLFFTSLTCQRVQVDSVAITLRGALGSRSMPWEALRRIEITEQRNPFAFTVVDFRRLQRVLRLESDGDEMVIHEPAGKDRKRRILSALLENAPDEARADLERAREQW